MSYFSDLSVKEKEIEVIDHDMSYPSPETQLLWRLENLIQEYLSLGGTQAEIQSSLDMPQESITTSDNELLYSADSSYSPFLIMRCIRIAWAKLIKRISTVDGVSEISTVYKDKLLLSSVLVQNIINKAA